MTIIQTVTELGVTEDTIKVQMAPSGGNHLLADPGNHPAEHFESQMSWLRFQTRQYLTRFTDNQSDFVHSLQKKHRTPFRDVYFKYTSLMGSHMFYVIVLPMPVWLGYRDLTRDMIYVLGYSIYLSGYLKDYWCLPRPKSPPVDRITLSEYTTKEYGAPSSHSANATAVSLLFFWRICLSDTLVWPTKLLLLSLVIFYYLTLVFGRVYCGMHGMLDLFSGAAVGAICFFIRIWVVHALRNFQIGEHLWFPLLSVAWGLFILFNHVRPIDECPCFEDSVAFIGVVSGLDCSDWLTERYGWNLVCSRYASCGSKVFLRPLVGVASVIIWKDVISKTAVYTLLIKLLRFHDDRGEKVHFHNETSEEEECLLYSGVSKVEIVGRFLIYAGIPTTVFLLCPVFFTWTNLR
ncbi:BAD_collapsed_G0034500.mRNA.1.CDS.1 [Saccharomyces cerevisiae]|nr:BAD_HP_G0005210.mRNA.1.CDS.1 [Saccharomyces cerevisiae]CAI4953277.1 BAD_HP_G0031900.mRNA.1.CDS.1 [Saccharomyces cerevisiae]CAI6412754.1 BAD_HP_G0005210.mRNA.1.CDS.1 [Saccharomyces cerevisiae]CAI6634039.1 BAD_HP_G0031900.mRNA.1.CDS.1 [Saccharomyces cerevisiae]CAI7397383.1 BAD_collapsed_G0034500.mRNA.1.CDS.1 [Saccharomyces cerevisiae]